MTASAWELSVGLSKSPTLYTSPYVPLPTRCSSSKSSCGFRRDMSNDAAELIVPLLSDYPDDNPLMVMKIDTFQENSSFVFIKAETSRRIDFRLSILRLRIERDSQPPAAACRKHQGMAPCRIQLAPRSPPAAHRTGNVGKTEHKCVHSNDIITQLGFSVKLDSSHEVCGKDICNYPATH